MNVCMSVLERRGIHINEAPKHPPLHLLRVPKEIRHTLLNPSHLFLGCEKLCKKVFSPAIHICTCKIHSRVQSSQLNRHRCEENQNQETFITSKCFVTIWLVLQRSAAVPHPFFTSYIEDLFQLVLWWNLWGLNISGAFQTQSAEDILKNDAIQWQFSGRD